MRFRRRNRYNGLSQARRKKVPSDLHSARRATSDGDPTLARLRDGPHRHVLVYCRGPISVGAPPRRWSRLADRHTSLTPKVSPIEKLTISNSTDIRLCRFPEQAFTETVT